MANQHTDDCEKDTWLKWKVSYLPTQYHLISYETMKQCCKYVFCLIDPQAEDKFKTKATILD